MVSLTSGPIQDDQCLNCREQCSRRHLYCRRCWWKLSRVQQQSIMRTYNSGRGAGSAAYRRAVRESLTYLRELEGQVL